jgi:hypothetical protein
MVNYDFGGFLVVVYIVNCRMILFFCNCVLMSVEEFLTVALQIFFNEPLSAFCGTCSRSGMNTMRDCLLTHKMEVTWFVFIVISRCTMAQVICTKFPS